MVLRKISSVTSCWRFLTPIRTASVCFTRCSCYALNFPATSASLSPLLQGSKSPSTTWLCMQLGTSCMDDRMMCTWGLLMVEGRFGFTRLYSALIAQVPVLSAAPCMPIVEDHAVVVCSSVQHCRQYHWMRGTACHRTRGRS